jgi:phosphonate transport system substrate-binding protein
MKTLRSWWLAVVLCLTLCSPALAQPEPLRIGIIPYLTPNVLMALFQPLRQQLEKDLEQPVELFTAPDVPTFARRTLNPDFDLLITAAHQARLAQLEGGYLPVVRFTGPLYATLIVGKDSPLKRLTDLKGKRIAITDRSILVNIAATKLLADQGITDKDIRYLPVNSQNTAILTVARGDADAAVIAHFALDQSPREQREAVRSLYRSPELPNVTVLLSPKLDPGLRAQIRKSLLALPNTPEGATFLEKSRFLGIQPVADDFMKMLDPYLPETRKQLGL